MGCCAVGQVAVAGVPWNAMLFQGLKPLVRDSPLKGSLCWAYAPGWHYPRPEEGQLQAWLLRHWVPLGTHLREEEMA